jgi:hypothetical protein
MFKRLLLILLGMVLAKAQGQFAPAAGQPGSTAIKADSSCFKSWALDAQVDRGLKQINWPDSGFATVGEPENATGPFGNGLVSLGDAGIATLTFDPPISNGPGFDFAVFENAFNDSFLELAHVEVSSNGIDWVRFPSESLSSIDVQTGAFGFTRPERIHHLAGKYRSPFGTPFDLEELKDSQALDLLWIPYVRLIDVVGSIDSAWGSRDSKGRLINDPWPSPFPSSGFDLDAVGVIHNTLSVGHALNRELCFYDETSRALRNCPAETGELRNAKGQVIATKMDHSKSWDLPQLPQGVYLFCSKSGASTRFVVR